MTIVCEQTPSETPREGSCSLEIVPFDCREETCECPDHHRSENCGVRHDELGFERVRMGYRATSATKLGVLKTDRVHPDSVEVSNWEVLCARTENVELVRCVTLFDVQAVPRPAVNSPAGPLDVDGLRNWLEHRPFSIRGTPELRPFTNREIYRSEMICDPEGDRCRAKHSVTVWDCDLITLCYQYCWSAAGQQHYGWPLMAGRGTVRQFFAHLAVRAGRALCEKYFYSAHGCSREVKDVNATACISAVLAEETFKAQVEGAREEPAWQEFFDLPDQEFQIKSMMAWTFAEYSEAFGKAHLQIGLETALDSCPTGPCLAEDLDTVVETLTRLQTPVIEGLTSAPGIALDMASIFEWDPETQFRQAMRKNILDALENAGEGSAHAELTDMWGENQ